jgi:hypothetical protein
MTIKIDKKIVGYKVVDKEQKNKAADAAKESQVDPVQKMNETVSRPEALMGTTYKIKPPVSEHAFYITINDVLLNEGTEHEQVHPYEIFINSKSMEHYAWVVAMTRVISAVFRKGGDATFLVEELKAVFDPKGGYFKPGTGQYMPSIVAEIGYVIETHMKRIGMLGDETDIHQQRYLDEKKAQMAHNAAQENNNEGFPDNAIMCKKCHQKAVITMDGCLTCLNCGDSKCG